MKRKMMTLESVETKGNYDPNNLLDSLLQKMRLKNDAALCRVLEVGPPMLSKIRHRRLPVGASLLIRMHEVSGLSISELRTLLKDNRKKYRASEVYGKPKAEHHSEYRIN
jgi:hypothetical protein